MANIFSVLIGALHESRRRQAVQIIRSYPHLLHEDVGRKISEEIAELRIASRVYTGPSRGEFVSLKGLGAKSLITALVLGFCILHVIGGPFLDHARPAPAGQRPAGTAQAGQRF